MPTKDSQRRASKKWIEKNYERHKESARESVKRWRDNNKDQYNKNTLNYMTKSRLKWSEYQKETKRLRNILFDGFIPIF